MSHRAIVDYIEWQCAYLPFDKNTVLGNQAPFYFDASMPDIYTPLCMGVTLYIIPEMLFQAILGAGTSEVVKELLTLVLRKG